VSEVVLIAAVARNGAIGRGNRLLWSEPEDQRHFRAATLGCPVIMGRRTWDSLPERFRPLPGRRNVVVTRQAAFEAPGAEVAAGLPQALALVADAPRVFVIGGGQLYADALPHADELLLTEIDADLDGDVFFPRWSREDFTRSAGPPRHSADATAYAFVRYARRRQPVT
jgi:dihydrofolate reductase